MASFDSLFSAMWIFGGGSTATAPVDSCWNWNETDLVVTEITLSHVDTALADRGADLATLRAGDRIYLRNTSTISNWAKFDVVTNADPGGWTLLTVALVGVGTVPGLPSGFQLVLFDFLRPAFIATGPIGVRFDEIVARVAELVNAEPDDVWVISAVAAAIEYATLQISASDGLPATELTVDGLVVFGQRIYVDAYATSGAQVAIGDPTFEPIFQPEHLWKHVRHYFRLRQAAWGVA